MGLAVWTRELFQTWGLAPEDDRAARPETCVFCKKVAEAENNPSAFAYVDAEIVVFRDWKPAARSPRGARRRRAKTKTPATQESVSARTACTPRARCTTPPRS